MQSRSHASAGARRIAVALLALLAVACGTLRRSNVQSTELWGFAAPWDPRSDSSVAVHGNQLTSLVSGWIYLDSSSFAPASLSADTLGARTAPLVRRMALVTSYHGNRFHPETIRGLGSDSNALGKAAGATGTLLQRNGYRGAVLDFEGMTPFDFDALMRVTRGFADSARSHGVTMVAIAIPANDTSGYPARNLLSAVDYVVVMLYDQHWLTSPPGAISAPDWAARTLGLRASDVGSSRIVAALPLYGYRWRSDSGAVVVSYAEAQAAARDAGVPLVRDPSSSTLYAEARNWSEWVSDATLVDSLVRVGHRAGVTRFALWRLGLEDPKIWDFSQQR